MRISHKDKTDLPRKRDHLEHKERRHLFFQRNLHQLHQLQVMATDQKLHKQLSEGRNVVNEN